MKIRPLNVIRIGAKWIWSDIDNNIRTITKIDQIFVYYRYNNNKLLSNELLLGDFIQCIKDKRIKIL